MTSQTETFPPGTTEVLSPHSTGGDRTAVDPILEPGARVGRYVVLRLIGSGGMGRVYAAHDPELDRKVALKLARTKGADQANWRARFLREAHAMARLSHPAVVPVFDVGTHEEAAFLAMELVEGTTLKSWLEVRRPWRDVVRVFAGAGRGLSTAHEAGLVHRDFKPSNVLMGLDGRPRVTDFGLVRALDDPEPAPDAGALPPRPASEALALPLTEAHLVLGTASYMAPEQHRARGVDARADQFSFGAALFEALAGDQPFQGRSASELLTAKEAGPPALPDRAGPPHLRRLLRRALDPDPGRRYPSMAELLVDLERDPGARARRWAIRATAAAAIALVAAGLTWTARERARSCDGAETGLAGVWDGAARERLRAAFLATGKPYAAAAADGAARALDRYASGWVAARRSACEATRVLGSQPEAVLALKSACLDGRRSDLRALVRVLSAGRPEAVQRAEEAASLLPALAACDDARALGNRSPLPEDPAARRRVESVLDMASQARALLLAGQFGAAAAAARTAVEGAEAIPYDPAVAVASGVLGEALQRTGNAGEAVKALSRAVEAGTSSHEDGAVAAAAVELVHAVGLGQGLREQALERVPFARAAVARAGGVPLLEVRLRGVECSVLREQGDGNGAVERCRQALDIARSSLGPDHPATARASKELGTALDEAERPEEALERFQEALDVEKRVLGPSHPELGITYNDFAITYGKLERWAEARDAYRRARDLLATALHPEHPFVGLTGAGLGRALHKLGDDRAAIEECSRALPAIEAALGPDHPWTASGLVCVGEARLAQGDARGALPPLKRAWSILEGQPGDPPQRSLVMLTLGKALVISGEDPARGRELLKGAQARMPKEQANELDRWLESARPGRAR